MTPPLARERGRLRAAIQKSGRLAEKTLELFAKSGLEFEQSKDRLFRVAKDFPLELMLVRDDDIPEYVADGVCDLGVVGENVIAERTNARAGFAPDVEILMPLGFGSCRLSFAYPEASDLRSARDLQGKRVATSYPASVRRHLAEIDVMAEVVELSGSVEIAPALGVADAVCDLVSTGSTLRSNGLREGEILLKSQACLVAAGRSALARRNAQAAALEPIQARLLRRLEGVLRAQRSKYVMMNAPAGAIDEIRGIIPGMEEPSVMPIGTDGKCVAIHAVASEDVFWDTIEKLKGVGASSILVLPIEKVVP